jgi:hypothetical protein
MCSGLVTRQVIGRTWLAGWAVAVTAGTALMFCYQMTPSSPGTVVAARWPGNVSVSRDATRPTLIMTLHPHCPCSRASVAELSLLMTRANGRLAARVLVVEPKGAPRDWFHGDLWDAAAAIPDSILSVDAGGADAAAFGATISGTVILYGSEGKMLFSGGITDGRGHEGDNPGLLAILSLIHHSRAGIQVTPVYGCPLRSTRRERGNAS